MRPVAEAGEEEAGVEEATMMGVGMTYRTYMSYGPLRRLL